MRGSPINWWKEKRQASHSGIPSASRPTTASPWAGDRDLQKIVEDAVLEVIESDAFKLAIASQVDPSFARHQEKLNQIKTANLNLGSTLQTFVEELPAALRPIQDQLTAIEIPEYGPELEALSVGQRTLQTRLNDVTIPNYEQELGALSTRQEMIESKLDDLHIPNYEKELNEIANGQTRLLKILEHRFTGLENRVEELDRRIEGLDESTVNSDLRSAIRFGELSNELQDRNTMLGDRMWGVERDLGKKIDVQQRKILDVYEELGKASRHTNEALETMQACLNEDRILTEMKKASSKAESAEKTLQRHILAIQQQVSNIETSLIPSQSSKLDVIDSGISDVKKELEASKKTASLDSKLFSAHASKLDNIVSAVGQIQDLAESTNEISLKVSESQEINATSAREDMEVSLQKAISLDSLAVSHAKKLEDAVSSITRIEQALMTFDAAALGKLGKLESSIEKVEQELTPLSSHSTKLDDLQSILGGVRGEMKPHKVAVDGLTTTISEMRTNFNTAFSSYDESLSNLQHKIEDTSSVDKLMASLSEIQGSIEQKISSSLSTAQNDTSRILEGMEDAKRIALGDKDHIVETLRSNNHAATSMKESIATLQTTILQALQTNAHALEEVGGFKPVAELSAKVDELNTSISNVISNSHTDLQSASRATAQEIIDQIQAVDGNLRAGFDSISKATDSRLGKLDAPIATILDEFQSIKATSVTEKTTISEEFQSIRSLVEASHAAHIKDATSIITMLEDGQRLQKDDEILTRLDAWEQTYISKQKADISTVTELLDSSRERDEAIQRSVADLGDRNSCMFEFLQSGNIKSSSSLKELGAIKSILEDKDEISSIKQNSLDTFRVLNEVQLTVNKVADDPTPATTKQLLLENASSMAMAQEGITAINTKITKSEDVISSAVQHAQAALEKHILDAISNVTTSMGGDLADLRSDLSTRISTTTDALTAEVKGIDSTAALGSLRDDLHSCSMAIHDSTKLISNDIEYRTAFLVESVTSGVKDLRNDHTKASQENVVALSHLKEVSTAKSASISEDLAKIQETLELVSETREDVSLIINGVQKLDKAVTHSAANLSSIQEAISRTDDRISEVSGDVKTAIDARGAETLQAVEVSHSIISDIQRVNNELLPKIQEAIKAIDLKLAKTASESEATKTAIISSITTTSASNLSEIESVRKSLDDDLVAAKSSIQDTKKALDAMSIDIHEALDKSRSDTITSQRAILATINTESKSLSDGAEAAKDLIVSEVQNLKAALVSDLTTVQKTLQSSAEGISNDLGAKIAGAAAESKESWKACDANFVTMSDTIHHEAEITQSAMKALRSDVISEVRKMDSTVSSILEDVKADIEGVSSEVNTVGASLRDEMKYLDRKTANGFTGLEAAVGQGTTTLSKSIGDQKFLVQSSFDSVSGGMRAIDAAVRVNSAAIARVDKAVLETGSQVKAVVHDGNREVLSQLSEQLFEDGTRIKGLSNFDIPRIEAIGKRNRDILEVIGTRVIGTAKKFDEMMVLHSQKHVDHRESLSGRIRGGSNASSSRDSLRMSSK